MKHELKIEPNYLAHLMAGRKKAEVRYNDRDYQLGDTLEFWCSGKEIGDGKFVEFKITHIHSGLGLQDNYVILSLDLLTTPGKD